MTLARGGGDAPAWSTTPHEAISASALRAVEPVRQDVLVQPHREVHSAKSTRLTPTSTSSAPTSTRLGKCAAAISGKLGGNIARTKRDATTYARRRNTKCRLSPEPKRQRRRPRRPTRTRVAVKHDVEENRAIEPLPGEAVSLHAAGTELPIRASISALTRAAATRRHSPATESCNRLWNELTRAGRARSRERRSRLRPESPSSPAQLPRSSDCAPRRDSASAARDDRRWSSRAPPRIR